MYSEIVASLRVRTTPPSKRLRSTLGSTVCIDHLSFVLSQKGARRPLEAGFIRWWGAGCRATGISAVWAGNLTSVRSYKPRSALLFQHHRTQAEQRERGGFGVRPAANAAKRKGLEISVKPWTSHPLKDVDAFRKSFFCSGFFKQFHDLFVPLMLRNP